VPILEHDGATMVESALVLQYVCATFETPGGASLRPTTAKAGYYGQLFADNFQACVPLYFKMLRATSEEELREATDAFVGGLKKANRCLELGADARAGGPYACGAQFTTCDIMAMTFVPRFEIVLAHYRGFDVRQAIRENDCAALESWMAAVSMRPSMQYTLAEIENMTGKTLADAFVDHFAKFVSWRPDSSGAAMVSA
jgi:glutathione S-transferase